MLSVLGLVSLLAVLSFISVCVLQNRSAMRNDRETSDTTEGEGEEGSERMKSTATTQKMKREGKVARASLLFYGFASRRRRGGGRVAFLFVWGNVAGSRNKRWRCCWTIEEGGDFLQCETGCPAMAEVVSTVVARVAETIKTHSTQRKYIATSWIERMQV